MTHAAVGGLEVPDWVPDAIFYQIFPDRFANGDPSNDPVNVVPWGSEPTYYNFMGGDLQGIGDRLPYLVDLGINAIYLNPVFWASSNHKYDTYSFYQIDPRFGSNEAFAGLLQAAHAQGIRVVLDGVFNHCGRGFFPFFDVMENREHSSYVDWFDIRRFPLGAYGRHTYATYGRTRKMPKLNVANPATRQYLLEVGRYWVAQGIDGWRLDAAADIGDHGFWRQFREVVKAENPDAYIFGEVWEDGGPWLQGDQFDGTTNYGLRGHLLDFFVYRTVAAEEFAQRVDGLLGGRAWSANLGMYNLLSSHDTRRILSIAEGDANRVKLAALFQFAFPGVPAIYYGDEIGLLGEADPDNRRAMPWDEGAWDGDLRRFFQRLIAIRKRQPALCRGGWQFVFADDPSNTCVFLRRAGRDAALLLVNNGEEPVEVSMPVAQWDLADRGVYVDLLNDRHFRCQAEGLLVVDLPPARGAILVPA